MAVNLRKRKQLVFAGNTLLGEVVGYDFWGDKYPHEFYCNYLYYCPHCGDVWGRVAHAELPATWNGVMRACRRCHPKSAHYARIAAGSFSMLSDFVGTSQSDISTWPELLVRWEFESLLGNYS